MVKIIDGIDMCAIQGKVDFRRMANEPAGGPDSEPMRFAYFKASQYSSTRDLSFDKYVEDARKAGLRVGAYHFCSQASDPVAQMDMFYKACKGLGKDAGDLPPMIDWEFCSVPPPEHCVQWLVQAAAHAEKLWYPENAKHDLGGVRARKPMIYTYPWFAKSHQPFLDRSGVGRYPLCQASYASTGRYYPNQLQLELILKKPISPWQRPTLLQYSGNGGMLVPGVKVDCDRDLFLGSEAEFEQFCGIFREAHKTELGVKE